MKEYIKDNYLKILLTVSLILPFCTQVVVWIVILTFAGTIGLIALIDWRRDLSSHAKLKRIVGRSLLVLTVLGLLIGLYFFLSITMCG